MLNDNYIKVFSGTFIFAQMVLDRLERVGINAIVKDESESGRLAGFASSIQGFQEIYVSQEELKQAIPIIETAKSELQT